MAIRFVGVHAFDRIIDDSHWRVSQILYHAILIEAERAALLQHGYPSITDDNLSDAGRHFYFAEVRRLAEDKSNHANLMEGDYEGLRRRREELDALKKERGISVDED